jgi:hypothetical protein
VAALLVEYMTSPPAFKSDPTLTTVEEFTQQIDVDALPSPAQDSPDPADVLRRTRK